MSACVHRFHEITNGTARPRAGLTRAVLCLALLGTFYSAWATATPELEICAAPEHQDLPIAASLESGSSLVAWTDHRSKRDADIFAQRLDSTGTAQWAADGIAICTAGGSQHLMNVVSDGQGGAILVWIDHRSADETAEDIYAQRVSAEGMPLWGADGVAVCRASGTQAEPSVAADGTGGAWIVWSDSRDGFGSSAARGQRLGSSGEPLWGADGVEIAPAADNQPSPAVVSDGAGGILVAWRLVRAGSEPVGVYARRLNGDGEGIWSGDKVTVTSSTQVASGPVLLADGAGGVFVVWSGGRLTGDDAKGYVEGTPRVWAQRLTASGERQWGAEGVAATPEGNAQRLAGAVPGLDGDCFLAWTEEVTTATRVGKMQRLDSAGVPQWIGEGRLFSNSSEGEVAGVSLAADAAGGVMLAWQDRRGREAADVLAARLNAAGEMLWGDHGSGGTPVPVTDQPQADFSPSCAPTGPGEMIVYWYRHGGGDHNILARKIGGTP